MRILTVNAGSSSLKLSVLDADELALSETLEASDGKVDELAVEKVISRAGPIDAVGHRVVHGGSEFSGPVLVDEGVLRRLQALSDLAPLHQAKSLAALELVNRLIPAVPAIACFDTAFHSRLPPSAFTYALPAEWRERWKIRRFGFHGLSHSYASRRASQMVGQPLENLRVVTCHLGAGASLAAVENGFSVDTTMGFTPLEGLVMATRSGSVDPGLLLWLHERAGVSTSELAFGLEHRSGLLGISGSADMQAIVAAREEDDRARLALGVYLHRLRAFIAAMAAAMGGLDVLVFTGGVGEHSPLIREQTAAALAFIGVRVDPRLNQEATPDADLTLAGAVARTLVVRAREDLEIAREVRAVLGSRADA